jgi:alanyl-tRNA synthetase
VLSAKEIRQSFIEFFESKQHTIVSSAPVVPQDDPTLMFTNAGMNPFKSIFLGENPKNYRRVANTQKCIRVSGKHNDLDEVGKDTYHHTLFEMLGNWSFGDYYKREAITWAWELLTEVWKLDRNRLFVTIHHSDDEAGELWREISGLPSERIMKFGDKENFWEMGETGPCGPCSEIHYDRGSEDTRESTYSDPVKGVNGTNDRYIEIWNLVFIQYQRLQDSSLKPLTHKHVDTGMGFERVCSIMQNVSSNYDTDVFTPLIQDIAQRTGVGYQPDMNGMPHRVIADHLRAVSFAIADGALPSNEGRGYVIRRILRRASRYARKLGCTEPLLYKLVPKLAQVMGEAFPELVQRMDFICQIIQSEEERFIRTLGSGLERFAKIAEETARQGQSQIPGDKVFTLYDTYGFPADLTRLLAEEKNMSIDEAGFSSAMEQQKQRARSSRKAVEIDLSTDEGWEVLEVGSGTVFEGYEKAETFIKIQKYRLLENGEVQFVASNTPFYAESGGQVGEKGRVFTKGCELEVFDTVKVNNTWVHRAQILTGAVLVAHMQEPLRAIADHAQRKATRRHHSATHLLHKALREVLGEHVTQQGSRVSADSLRFDFSHFSALTPEQLLEVETLVNDSIMANLPVETTLEDLDSAKSAGAMALFGEKYEDQVRVVRMGDYSVELCGGLHVQSTGEIGSVRILVEASISAGVRRIEAVAGEAALKHAHMQGQIIQSLSSQMKAQPEELASKVEQLLLQQRELEKANQVLQGKIFEAKFDSYWQAAKEVQESKVLVQKLDGISLAQFPALLESVSSNIGAKRVAVLVTSEGEQVMYGAIVSQDLHKKVKAGDLVKVMASVGEGKGGGRPDRAQAGSRRPDLIEATLAAAQKFLEEALV